LHRRMSPGMSKCPRELRDIRSCRRAGSFAGFSRRLQELACRNNRVGCRIVNHGLSAPRDATHTHEHSNETPHRSITHRYRNTRIGAKSGNAAARDEPVLGYGARRAARQDCTDNDAENRRNQDRTGSVVGRPGTPVRQRRWLRPAEKLQCDPAAGRDRLLIVRGSTALS
jgi:hypothetical protein